MKKLLVAAAAAAGVLVYTRWQGSVKEKKIWSNATDPVA
ncbi:DLW-39 family protein [uncultured Arthrobacter sp.]|nr:DLW-39 family protein [uncultured Arthrobacter sp.]